MNRYTNSGLLEEIETGSGQSLVTRYHDVYGLDSCLIYGNGVERIFNRTPRALIKEDEIYDGTASLIYDKSLNYRSDGRLSSVYSDDTLSASYQYDHYGRLTGENYQDGSFNYSYLYDKVGNRLKSNDDTLRYYTGTNRLKTAYADSFAYNGDGAATFVGGNAYEYNWKNRVEHIDVNDGYIDHDFFYDYDFQGLRVRKEEKTVSGREPFIITSSSYIYYLYDVSGRLLCEYDDEGNLKRKFVYLPSAIIQISGNDTSYLHLDNLGSPAVVTNEDGNVIKSYRYYAFGSLRAQSGSFNTDYSFTGYLKEETGNHYAKMRYYEGGIGRFLRPDPLGALNPYVYCENDPLNFVDREGMSKEMAGSMDPGERLEGEGDGLFGSFGDWCSGGGPEMEDILDEYMEELQEWVNDYLENNPNGYLDGNLTGNLLTPYTVGTAGILVTSEGIHFYIGFGLGVAAGKAMGASTSVTVSSLSVSPGWHVGLQGSLWKWSGQLGIRSQGFEPFQEHGAGIKWQGMSATLTAFYVSDLRYKFK